MGTWIRMAGRSIRIVALYPALLSMLLPSCSFSSGRGTGGNVPGEPWSVRMAGSVMARNEGLLRYNNAEKIKWQYDIAMLAMAMDRLGHIDQKYSLYMEQFMDYFIQQDGSILHYELKKYNLDYVNPAKNLITLYKRTGEERYRIALEQIIHQLEEQPRTHSGGFWHKQVYPWQMWLDGSYMASPFMAQYAREFDNETWMDEAVFQLIQLYDRTHDERTGLLYHAWDESRSQRWCDPETGLSRIFWGRAMGWYMMALVDVLDFIPGDHPGRKRILEILETTSEALLRVRDEDSKLWYQVLDQGNRQGNYLEASASAMFVYAFAKAAGKGYLEQRFRDVAEESFDGLLEHFIHEDEDGGLTMTSIVGGCGLGGDPYRDGSYEYYTTEKQVDNDPKGVAPFILAALELDR